MVDLVTEHTTIGAPPDACLSVALDFERYPEWAHDLKEAVVVERDDEGRGVLVRFRAAGMGYSSTYTLRYDHGDAGTLAWVLEKGDLTRRLDGYYRFTGTDDPGVTEVTYQLEAELILPLPGFVKRRTQRRIMHTALADLKARVERVKR